MDNALHRLTYYSRNLIEDDAALRSALDDILAASDRNNRAANITGALLVSRGCFGQILEGYLPAIEAAFERIQQDDRHGDVHLLEIKPTNSRIFGKWSMTLAAPPETTGAKLSFAGVSPQFDPAKASAETLFDTLVKLVNAREDERFRT